MRTLSAILLVSLVLRAGDAVTVTEINSSLMVFATSSGNVIASVGPDGALLIGTPSLASTAEISGILAKRTKSPVRYVVIAPQDTAHSEGDAGWGARGAFVAMQENALERLGGHRMGPSVPLPPRLVQLGVDRPRIAFSEVLTFDVNGEAIHVVHQASAYSNADALVHFHIANLLYFGEVFPGDGYPEISAEQSGKLDGFVKMLSPWARNTVRVLPARGKVTNGGDLQAFCQMITSVRDSVQHMIEAGKTEDQVLAEHPTAEFDARWGRGRVSPDAFVRSVYAALKAH
ncbi:MAG: hypothetical protein WB992_17320 [Bryobacteraceae bacterium]